MDKQTHIADVIKAELDRPNGERESEALRWAVWMCWEDFGDVAFEGEPKTMNSTEFADACETLGIRRNTAMNRYSEARRNWIG